MFTEEEKIDEIRNVLKKYGVNDLVSDAAIAKDIKSEHVDIIKQQLLDANISDEILISLEDEL